MALTIENKVVNVGTGAGQIFRDENAQGQFNLKTIKAGSGVTVTNNADDVALSACTRVEMNDCINAVNFVPAQSPFSPAPIEDYYIAASGFAGKVIRLIPGFTTAASCFWSNRWYTHPGTAFYTVNTQVNFFTDNASTNNVILAVYYKSGSTTAFNLSTAPALIAPQTVAGIGSYRQLRAIFQFNTSGDNYQLFIERQGGEAGDTNPGTIYVQSILLSFNVALD